jgi:hypothetical protein
MGYNAAMLVEESRILQVSIFNTLQKDLSKGAFSKVLGRDHHSRRSEFATEARPCSTTRNPGLSPPGRAA